MAGELEKSVNNLNEAISLFYELFGAGKYGEARHILENSKPDKFAVNDFVKRNNLTVCLIKETLHYGKRMKHSIDHGWKECETKLNHLLLLVRGLPGHKDILYLEIMAVYNWLILHEEFKSGEKQLQTSCIQKQLTVTLRRVFRFIGKSALGQELESSGEDLAALFIQTFNIMQSCSYNHGSQIVSGLAQLACVTSLILLHRGNSSEAIDLVKNTSNMIDRKVSHKTDMCCSMLMALSSECVKVQTCPGEPPHLTTDILCLIRSLASFSLENYKACLQNVSRIQSTCYLGLAIYVHGSALYAQLEWTECLKVIGSLKDCQAGKLLMAAAHNMAACCLVHMGHLHSAVEQLRIVLDCQTYQEVAMYNLAHAYNKLNLQDAELEMLNLLVKNMSCREIYSPLVVMMIPPGATAMPAKDLVSLFEVMYILAHRCLQLERYDVAGEKYLDLLTLLTQNKSTSVAYQETTRLPSLRYIFHEAMYALLRSQRYMEVLTLAEHLKLKTSEKLCDSKTDGNGSEPYHSSSKLHTLPEIGMHKKTSQDRGKKRGRLPSEEDCLSMHNSSLKGDVDVVALKYEADALLRLGHLEAVIQVTDRLIASLEPRLAEGADSLASAMDTNSPLKKKQRTDRGYQDHNRSGVDPCGRAGVQPFLAQIYSTKCLALIASGKNQEALHWARLAHHLQPDSHIVVSQIVLLLHQIGRPRESRTTWRIYRGHNLNWQAREAFSPSHARESDNECAVSATSLEGSLALDRLAGQSEH